jgi:hypothetical protein
VDKAIPDQSAPIELTRTAGALRRGGGGTFEDDVLSGILGNPKLKAIADRLDETEGALSYSDARTLRTTVRGMLTDPGARGDISQGALKQIYSALTDDLKDGVRTLGGSRALTEYNRANQFTRAGVQRWDRAMSKILKVDSPEKAYEQLVTAATRGKSADLGKLYAVKRSLSNAEWDDVASTMIAQLGKPTAGRAGAEAIEFSPATFVTNFAKMTPEARNAVFVSSGRADLARELDGFVRVLTKLKNAERLGNPSGSGVYNMFSGLLAAGAGETLLSGGIPSGTLASVLAGYGGARLLSSPKAVNALSRLASASGQTSNRLSQGGVPLARALADLRAVGAAQPDLAPTIRAVAEVFQTDGETQAQPMQ